MEILKENNWQTELKVLYLADYKKVKSCTVFFIPERFSLAVVVSGSVCFSTSTHSVSLSAGDITGLPHGADLKRLASPLRICLISCSANYIISNRIARLGSACMRALISQTPFVFCTTPSEIKHLVALFGLLNKMISRKHTIFQDELVMLCINLIFYEFCGLYYKYSKHKELVHYPGNKIVTNFVILVERNFKEHHDIKFYADSLFISQGHLRKTVRSVMEIAAKHFIEMALIKEAYVVLADKNLSIADVSEYLNFKDSSSFSHFFKKHAKLSPTQYRLNLKFECTPTKHIWIY